MMKEEEVQPFLLMKENRHVHSFAKNCFHITGVSSLYVFG